MKKLIMAAALGSALALAFVSVFVPVSASAQAVPLTPSNSSTVKEGSGSTVKEAPPPAAAVQTECGSTLCNPLKGVDSVGGLIFKIVDFVYKFSYIVVAIFLMISGFKFVTAQGSEDKLKDAKSTFFSTIVGAVLLIGANVITKVIETVITSFRT